ncbi:ribosome recycling factor [Candidatus Saccharibacteria bacterium]|nr:ribosome recycling factor [Candidatus Saccharibacteria bacterium]MBI3338399.1 ribosome recycling factor [Candidatus Saccharibacteria bacterium]
MNSQQVVDQAKAKFTQAQSHFLEELKKLRTGRAHPSMLDGVMIEAYGTEMPLIQVGTVSTPEPQLLQITPFDPNNLQAISTAIRNTQNLGMNPMDDGRVVRVPIPPLNEERRHDFVKLLGTRVEDCMVSLRNIRHDAIRDIDQAKKAKLIGEDDAKRLEKQIDDAMSQAKKEVEVQAKTKEQEITTL